jgi:hypothetical protein
LLVVTSPSQIIKPDNWVSVPRRLSLFRIR